MDAVTDRELQDVRGGLHGLTTIARAAEGLQDASWGLLPEKTEAALRENVGELLKILAAGLAEQAEALDLAVMALGRAEREAA